MPVAQCTTKRERRRTIVEHIRHSTEPLLCAQPARVAAPACATCACTASRNCLNSKPERVTQHVQELRHPGCTQCIAIARANATTVRSFYRQNLHEEGSSRAASH